MKNLYRAVLAAFAFAIIFAFPAHAQQQVGRCIDQTRGQSFAVLSNLYMFQEGFPQNAGLAVRDPSGLTFLRVPALDPTNQAFFVDWQGRLVEINRSGWYPIGFCQFQPSVPVVNPYANLYQPPVMSDYGVPLPNGGFQPLPQQIVDPNNPFAPPMVTSEAKALECYRQSGGDRNTFGDCMVRAMAGDRERAAYDCARQGGGAASVSICMIGALGGENERRIANALAECRNQYGDDYRQYPLCLAGGQVGGEAARVLACVQQQSQQGQVTVMGTALCYGASSIRLNPELQIAAQCAVSTGGQPYAFAACAGGQLTARELDKCFTDGVGGPNGCFGPNNTIVQALNGVGQFLGNNFGPNNTLVSTWNTAVRDLRNGPGPNHEVVRTLRNVGNELGRARENVRREVRKVLPHIRVRW